jgi:hypothetical protein
VIGSVSALPIAFTAHVGGFIAGVLMTKVLVKLDQTKRKNQDIFCSRERKEVSLPLTIRAYKIREKNFVTFF